MFIFSEKEKLRYAVVNVYKNGVYGFPCSDRSEAEWRAGMMTGLAYRIVVWPKDSMSEARKPLHALLRQVRTQVRKGDYP